MDERTCDGECGAKFGGADLGAAPGKYGIPALQQVDPQVIGDQTGDWRSDILSQVIGDKTVTFYFSLSVSRRRSL